jgi:hypothetical protein
MENLKNKTVLVVDSGMFMELAIRLSKDFGRTLLYTDWKSEYPKSQDDMIGIGVPGIDRVSDLWKAIDNEDIDLFVFPSIYNGDLQLHLESLGKRVWGSRNGDELERFRLQANKAFGDLGLPRPTMVSVKGIDALRRHLKGVEDKYIKVSNYRGNFETWHHENYELSEPILDEMEHDLGIEKKVFEFLIEDPISGDDIVECGYDGICIDGKYPSKTIMGYEAKDTCYLCVVKDYNKISPLITDFNEKVSDIMKKYKYRNFMSTEIRVGKDKVPAMIDFTARIPSPPGELYMEMVKNISEVIWYGAEGILVEPEFEGKYGVEVMINSEWAQNKWQTIHFPEKIRRWVKLRNLAIIDGIYCVIPKYPDFANIGAVIAIGDTMEECIEKVKEYADQIKGYGIDVKIGSIDKIKDVIAKGEKIGIKF